MDEAENTTPEPANADNSSASDVAKEAANQMKEEAEKALGEIRGRGIMGFLSFDHLYFPIIARYIFIIVCIVSVIGIVFGFLGGLIALFTGKISAGIGAMIGAVVFGFLGLIGTRIWFELIILGFKVNENLEKILAKISK